MQYDGYGSSSSEVIATTESIKDLLNIQWPELKSLFTDDNIRQAILLCDNIQSYCKDMNGNYTGSMRALQFQFSNNIMNKSHLELIKEQIEQIEQKMK